jgi:hypothetical protein
MKRSIQILIAFALPCLFLSALSGIYPALADEGNISKTDKYAWSENTGWINFRPAYGGVTVHDTYLSGYAWSANIGWIKLGNDSGGPYQNTAANNWGINTDAEGRLSGYGWSETWGWISFKTNYSQVTIDPEGRFDGYAWSQNVGWIHFQNSDPAYSVRKINIAPVLTAANPEMAEISDDDADNAGALISEIIGDSVSDVGNGALEGIAVYAADPGNGEWQYSLDNGNTWESAGNVSETAALLLGADDRIRFVPEGLGEDQASFSFYAWDQTSGIPGEKADVSVRGDTAAFSSAGDIASVTVALIIDISGHVTYYTGEEPISQVLVTLESADGFSDTASTDDNGYFEFYHVPPGDYTLIPSKSGDPGSESLTAEDASKIARYVVRDYEFDEYQQIAADVNENDRITGLDASDVARYQIGLLPAMNDRENNWAFSPDSVNFRADSDIAKDFAAVRLGDVSGNYSAPAKTGRDRPVSESTSIHVNQGERLSIPVVLNDGREIEGIDLRINFDPDILVPTQATLIGGILEYETYQLVANLNGDDWIAAAIFAETGNLFSGSGIIAYLEFDVVGTKENAVIEFTRFQCNESPVFDKLRQSETVSGGFYINDTISQRLILNPGETEPMLRDLNKDRRIGAEDSIFALQQGDVKTAIEVLQYLVGIK